MSWTRRTAIATQRIKAQHDALAAQLRATRERLQVADRQRAGLQVLLEVRGERIDALTVQIDRLQQERKALTAEADHLAQLFQRESATETAPK